MKTEKSCGGVVFTRENGQIKYVIIQSTEGFYGFPKGHIEASESEEETALREIKEETGLDVMLIRGFRTTDEHPHTRSNHETVLKQIVYFLAEFREQELSAQESEVSSIALMDFEEATDSFQFESSKRILQEASSFIMEHFS